MKKTPGLLFVLRYGIGGAMVIAGIVLLITNSGGFGVDGFALGVGGGLSLIMLNALYRLGVSGDREREDEEDARTFFDVHGRWPDEADDVRPLSKRLRESAAVRDDSARALGDADALERVDALEHGDAPGHGDAVDDGDALGHGDTKYGYKRVRVPAHAHH
jgi:hypothetical protein